MKTKVVYAALIGLLAACFALPAMAQTVTAAITGVVTDPSGAVVPRATVIAENTATGVQTTAQTNDTGAYTIRFLPIGTYTLNITRKLLHPRKWMELPSRSIRPLPSTSP